MSDPTTDLMNAAAVRFRAGQIPEAHQLCLQILSQNPDHTDALHLLGFISQQTGQLDQAAQLISRAVALRPDVLPYRFSLGNVYSSLLRWDQAAAEFRHILARQPNNLDALNALAVAQHQAKDVDGALATWKSALAIQPDSAAVHAAMGAALAGCKRFREAIDSYRKAVAARPDVAFGHSSLGSLLLLLGEYPEGWNEFEWRLGETRRNLNRNFPQPQWNGEHLAGRTLLLHVEGGLGDGIQFVRYLPTVAQQGAKIILECQPALVPLFRDLQGFDQLIARGQPLPPFDRHCPLIGLPRVLGTRIDNIPSFVPYLKVPPDLLTRWQSRVPHDGVLNVGLVWAGTNVRSPQGSARTRTLDAFAPLAAARNVRFFSVQAGPESAQPRPPGLELVDYSADLTDMAHAAALVSHLDLVITVDTSVAHLCGALARPVWVLIPFIPDFRWLLDRTDCPWYPTMRLFRQPAEGDWNAPFSQIIAALTAHV